MISKSSRKQNKQKLNSIPTIKGSEMVLKGLIDESVFYMDYSEYKEYQKQFKTTWWKKMSKSK